MSSFLPTIASTWSATQAAGSAISVTGNKVFVGGGRLDKVLFYVNAAGTLQPGGPSHKPISTDVAVLLLANQGPIELMYVKNEGAAIQLGSVVSLRADSTVADGVEIVVASATTVPLGVALFDLVDGEFAWIAVGGVVPVLCNAAVTIGDELDVGAGDLVAAAAQIDSVATAKVTNGGAGLNLCRLLTGRLGMS